MENVARVVDLKNLNLTAALRILAQAGRNGPTNDDTDPLAQLQALIDALCELSMHDGLTGLVNAVFFQAALASELDRSFRTGRGCGLMLIDLDEFKLINDTHGHDIGDHVLRSVAIQLKKSLRSMDTAARAGGDEFAVILPECTPEDAVSAATRIHGTLNPLTVTAADVPLSVTASAGLVWTEPGAVVPSKMLLARADTELYRAKRAGRRRLSHPQLVPTRLSTAEHAAFVLHGPEEDSYGK
jgi:diguanylate cyclase (GGDEF)-like protein